MPVSRISAEAAIRLGHKAELNEWCSVRPCSDTGRLGEVFRTKVASTLEIMPSEGMGARWPLEKEYRWPDVVIRTREWSLWKGSSATGGWTWARRRLLGRGQSTDGTSV
jgi:hypothetical protein